MQKDRSTLNPAGAARRRLIKAVGLGLVGSQISFDWNKPKVSIGSTPVHAQPSVMVDACTVGYTVSMSANADTMEYSIQLTSSGSDGASFGTGTSVNASATNLRTLTGSYVQPSGESVFNGFLYTVQSLGTLDLTWSATCCTEDAVADASISVPTIGSATGDWDMFGSTAAEDGECTIILPT